MTVGDLSLVIPVYNEGDNIPTLFDAIAEHIGSEVEILICYDFEEDNTLPPVQARLKDFPGVRLVKNEYGRGPLGAIRSGFDAASRPGVLVVMADLSDDLARVPEMIDLLGDGCSVVAGSRYMKGGKQLGGPLLKSTLSRLAGVSLHYLVGLGTHDATNSFKLYSKEYLDSVQIESTGGFEIGIELTVKAHVRGLKIGEVPATWTDRTAGESRFRLKQWLPYYLHWYTFAIRRSWLKRGKRQSCD
jgi:dolichol-phosphate mannosyltransferase